MSPCEPRCQSCRHFTRAAAELEALLPGLRTLSSAYAAVRSEDGLCSVHDRYVAAYSHCAAHQRQESTPEQPQRRPSQRPALIR
jgi:hypothetical protein